MEVLQDPNVFPRHGNTPEARPGPFVTCACSWTSWTQIYCFFLAKLNLSVLDWSTSQFISYEEPTDQTESFWFGMTFQRRFGARPLSVQNSRKSEQQPFKPHRINKSQTRKKKNGSLWWRAEPAPKRIHEKPRKLWLILKLTCFLNQMLAFFQACSRSSKMIVACLRPNW